MSPHEQRVVAEHGARCGERERLSKFLGSDICKELPVAERDLLIEQHKIMWDLTDVLQRRIKLFKT